MTTAILKERITEMIGDGRVTGAVFYTFNFDVKFFEHYLLPAFLRDIPFSDNQIQNAILWRKYQDRLPPVTVYCDFHAKMPDAPTLGYDVRPVDLKKVKKGKPCFHPKVGFILVEDPDDSRQRLITMVGSGNLSWGGWSKNLEAVTLLEFRNNRFFPRSLKDDFRDFSRDILRISPLERSEAEGLVEKFFRKTLYTDEVKHFFYHSLQSDFYGLLEELKDNFNKGLPFQEMEIHTPYLSKGIGHLQKIKYVVGTQRIRMALPLAGTDEIALEESLYRDMVKEGVQWCSIKYVDNTKGFRFNHSKVYRLRGDRYYIEIIGSVNFTEAASRGYRDGGNVETAICLVHKEEDWVPMLAPAHPDVYRFVGPGEDPAASADRPDVPDIRFSLDWASEKLGYQWGDPESGGGSVHFDDHNKIQISKGSGNIRLARRRDVLKRLAENAIIPFRYKRHTYYFYPTQLNLEAKPLPAKLQLSDLQILELWGYLEQGDRTGHPGADMLEKFIESRTQPGDSVLSEPLGEGVPSTLNVMAAHLNGLIRLEKKLMLDKPRNNRERRKQEELQDYYLFTDNIDTLPGYRRVLFSLREKGSITAGFYYVLLCIIRSKFYEPVAKRQAGHKFMRELKEEQEQLRLELTANGVDKKKVKWVRKMIGT